jgi:aspartate 1-decarboxylase
MLKSKLHRARVTATHVDYEGSIVIDEDLMDEVGIVNHEQVHIYNITSGERFVTYALTGERGSGIISINGAAARLAQINDRIIIAAYGMISANTENYEPCVVLLDSNNKIVNKIPA